MCYHFFPIISQMGVLFMSGLGDLPGRNSKEQIRLLSLQSLRQPSGKSSMLLHSNKQQMCFHFDCKNILQNQTESSITCTGSYCVILKCSFFNICLDHCLVLHKTNMVRETALHPCGKRRLLQLLASHLTMQSSGPYTGSQNTLHEVIVETSGERTGQRQHASPGLPWTRPQNVSATFDHYDLSQLVSWKQPITNLVPEGQDTEPSSCNSFAAASGVSVTVLQGRGGLPQ